MEEKEIHYSELKENMVLSRDIFSDTGVFLMPKDTILSKNHLLKLKIYNVDYVYISIQKHVSKPKVKVVPITQTIKFVQFSEDFSVQANDVKDIISTVVDSGQVDTESVFNLVDNMLSSINHNTSSVFSYLCRLKNQDDVIYMHSLSVALLVNIFGKWLHLSNEEIKNLTIAGALHDIGMTQIKDSILHKPGLLAKEEMAALKEHTVLGYQMVADLDIDNGIKQAILLHHERMNGYGYLGVHWDNVHKYAKIIGIVDVFEAMTSDRPHHKRRHPFEIIRMFEEEGYGVLDTEYLYVFLQNIAHNYIGNRVRLTNGEEGNIVFINHQSPSRPMIQTENGIVDLMEPNNIDIEKFI